MPVRLYLFRLSASLVSAVAPVVHAAAATAEAASVCVIHTSIMTGRPACVSICYSVTRRKQQRPGIATNVQNSGPHRRTNKPTMSLPNRLRTTTKPVQLPSDTPHIKEVLHL